MDVVIVTGVPVVAYFLRPGKVPEEFVIYNMFLGFILWVATRWSRACVSKKPEKYDRKVHVFAKGIDLEFARFMFGDVDPNQPFPIVHGGAKYESEVGTSFDEAIFVWRPRDNIDGLGSTRSEATKRVGRLRTVGIKVTIFKAIRDGPGWRFEEVVPGAFLPKVPRALSCLQ